jgi:hypothetical protein
VRRPAAVLVGGLLLRSEKWGVWLRSVGAGSWGGAAVVGARSGLSNSRGMGGDVLVVSWWLSLHGLEIWDRRTSSLDDIASVEARAVRRRSGRRIRVIWEFRSPSSFAKPVGSFRRRGLIKLNGPKPCSARIVASERALALLSVLFWAVLVGIAHGEIEGCGLRAENWEG